MCPLSPVGAMVQPQSGWRSGEQPPSARGRVLPPLRRRVETEQPPRRQARDAQSSSRARSAQPPRKARRTAQRRKLGCAPRCKFPTSGLLCRVSFDLFADVVFCPSRRHADTGVLSLAPLKHLALSAQVISSELHPQPPSTEPAPPQAEEVPVAAAAAEASIVPPLLVPVVTVERVRWPSRRPPLGRPW
jgi:hypothetical protein